MCGTMVSQSKTACAVPFVVSTRYTNPSNIPAVKARPSGSLGINLTSMVPSAVGISIVRRIDRLRRSQTRMIPRSSGSPGTTFSELAGIMKSDVTIRLRSGRAEMPCGLKSCSGGSAGHSPVSCRLASNSATRPGVPAGVGAHLRDQESAVLQRQEVVRDVGKGAAGREHEFRLARLRYIKEEDAVLPPQQSQQPATGQDVLVGGQMAMVRLISGAAGSWNGNRPDDPPIAGRVFVEVDDGQEVGGDSGLVACPDVEGPFFSVVVVVLSGRTAIRREREPARPASRSCQPHAVSDWCSWCSLSAELAARSYPSADGALIRAASERVNSREIPGR